MLFQTDRLLERQALRGIAHQEFVLTRDQLPGILVDVEDGKILLIEIHGYFLALSRIQFDFAPPHQTLWRFSRRGWQGRVNLRDFGPSPIASIRHSEIHTNVLTRGYFQIGIGISCVGEAEAEWKQHLLVLGLIPLVSNLQPLVISDLECE